jgi:hypothetical protein
MEAPIMKKVVCQGDVQTDTAACEASVIVAQRGRANQ